MLPILLDLTGKRVAVIGGGAIGQRKAVAAADARATVHIVALESRPSDFDPRVTWIAESYRAEHLAGAVLVFAAGPSELNEIVWADATALGIWVNDAAVPERGDFILPAIARQGRLTIAVSTGGASPALAARIRDRLASEIDEAFATWIDLLSEVRTLVAESIADPTLRARLLMDLAEWPWLERIRRDGRNVTLEEMRAAVRRAV